jgi:tetratricopeptide (TPR) repeat protein
MDLNLNGRAVFLGAALLVSSVLVVPLVSAQRTSPIDGVMSRVERDVAAGRTGRAVRTLRASLRRTPGEIRLVRRVADLTIPPAVSDALRSPSADVLADAAALVSAIEALVASDAQLDAESRAWCERTRRWARALAGEHGGAIDESARAAGLQDTASAAELVRLAALAIVRDDLASAERALEAAHRALPQDVAITADLATVHVARGRPDRAVPLYESALGRSPGDVDLVLDLAGARIASADVDGAIALLTRLASRAEDVRADLALAQAYLTSGRASSAIEPARRALARSADDDARAALTLGDALSATGSDAEAIAAYEEALRRAPRSARARAGIEAVRARAEEARTEETGTEAQRVEPETLSRDAGARRGVADQLGSPVRPR